MIEIFEIDEQSDHEAALIFYIVPKSTFDNNVFMQIFTHNKSLEIAL